MSEEYFYAVTTSLVDGGGRTFHWEIDPEGSIEELEG